MADLITLAEAKTHLNIRDSSTDAELTTFVTVSSDLVEEKANRTWRDTSVVEYHTGGTNELLLYRSPVKTITSIVDQGTTIPSTEYRLIPETGRVIRNYVPFVGLAGEVVVTYTAGITTVPELVKHATREVLRHLWQTQRGSQGGRSPLAGDDYVASSGFSVPNRVAELIDGLSAPGGIG